MSEANETGKKRLRVYISLPITGRDLALARAEADAYVHALSRMGHVPVNPLNIYAGKDPDYAAYMGADLTELLRCDAMVQADGWEMSKGCRLEHYACCVYGIRLWPRYKLGEI